MLCVCVCKDFPINSRSTAPVDCMLLFTYRSLACWDAHMLDCWLVQSPSTVFCRFGGWSRGWFVCCHLAVTLSHFEHLSMDKCHGSQKVWTMQWVPWQNQATTAKWRLRNMSWWPLQQMQRTPLQGRMVLQSDESLCFIMMNHDDSSL